MQLRHRTSVVCRTTRRSNSASIEMAAAERIPTRAGSPPEDDSSGSGGDKKFHLNLENFDGDDVPDDCPYVLTSPRSLEACKRLRVQVSRVLEGSKITVMIKETLVTMGNCPRYLYLEGKDWDEGSTNLNEASFPWNQTVCTLLANCVGNSYNDCKLWF